MASKGTLTVRIIGDAKSFNGALDKMSGGLSSILGPIGMVGGAIVGLGVTAGAALFGIGNQFDKVHDIIRTGTGATGADLDGLMESFRNVAREVPNSFGEVATAVADLNTRLGVTGRPLEDLATQVLTLARLTKTDLGTAIPAVTRLLNDWSVPAGDAADALDKLFVASQNSGASIDQLAQNAVQFGSPLRQLGFTFEETLALFGSFEQAGVNIETVMSGLRQSVGNFAREGEKPAEAIRRVIDEIKNVEDPAEAATLAMEAFGTRAGADLTAAIREGRFDLAGLVDTLATSTESIQQAADDTDSFSEAWSNFKNNVLLALEGPATAVFGTLTSLIQDNLLPAVQRIADAFQADGVQGGLQQLQTEWEAFWLGTFKPWLEDNVVPFFAELGQKAAVAFGRGIVNNFPTSLEGLLNALGIDTPLPATPNIGQLREQVDNTFGGGLTPDNQNELLGPPAPAPPPPPGTGVTPSGSSSVTTNIYNNDVTVTSPTDEQTAEILRDYGGQVVG